MAECNRAAFAFETQSSRRVEACSDASWITTDGGTLLLREADGKIDLLKRVAACFADARNPERIDNELDEMLAKRI